MACFVFSFIKGAPLVQSEALAMVKEDYGSHDHEVKTLVIYNLRDSSLHSRQNYNSVKITCKLFINKRW